MIFNNIIALTALAAGISAQSSSLQESSVFTSTLTSVGTSAIKSAVLYSQEDNVSYPTTGLIIDSTFEPSSISTTPTNIITDVFNNTTSIPVVTTVDLAQSTMTYADLETSGSLNSSISTSDSNSNSNSSSSATQKTSTSKNNANANNQGGVVTALGAVGYLMMMIL